MKCPKCKETYDDNFKFCPYCGEEKPAPKICPNCELEPNVEFSFCPECGTELVSKSQWEELKREKLKREEIHKLNEQIMEYEKLEEYEKAFECCDKAIELEPENISYWEGKRVELKRVFLIIDFRMKPTEDDLLMYNFLKYYNIPVTVIATKADKVSGSKKQKNLNNILETLQLVLGDDLIVFSSVSKLGVNDVLNKIDSLLGD